MPEQPLNNSTEENKQPNIEVGAINVGGSVGGNLVVGNNNVINLSPKEQVFRSLHQLPQPPADFTGREELIAQLLADFESGKGATIHGLTGMGGIGKTALGLAVAHQITKDYPDAQISLDLKGTTMPLSATDIMRHVILSFEPAMDLKTLDEAGMLSTYRSLLHGKRALLFLDNARSADQIAPLRPPETCTMLVTSRWVFGVPGLHSRRLDVMSGENAEKFLLELCPRIGDYAAELAKACAYLPLALRIAGSFLGVNEDWGVEKYITRLSDRKHRLATLEQSREEAELKTEPDLLATFELSYNGLSEENQKRWRMLGVFPGSFAANAVVAIWELEEDAAEGAARKLLGLLLRYSLLDYEETSSRYSLQNLLADYALAQMNESEEQKARLKHASHYKDILSVAEGLYREGGEKVLTGLRLFDLEWENIQAGQAWAVATGKNNQILSELCMVYPEAGAYVLDVRQHPRERIQWLEAALSAARELGNRFGEGAALSNLGNAYEALGEAHKAIEFQEQALTILHEIGDRGGEGIALGNLGLAYADLGDAHKAIEFQEQRLAIMREIGDRHGEGQALGNLGLVYADLGDVHKSIEFHEQDLAIAREIGDRRGEGAALGNLGTAYYRLGDIRKAIEFYEQHLVIAREIGDRNGEGNALGNLGNAYADLGEFPKAIDFYEQHLVIGRETGDRRGEGISLGNLGGAYKALGDAHKAIEFHEQALAIARETGDRHGEGKTLGNLGNAYRDLGDAHKAIEFYEQSLVIAREIGDRQSEGNALGNLGLVLYDLEEKDRAIDLVKQALEIYEAIESPAAEQARNALKEWGAL